VIIPKSPPLYPTVFMFVYRKYPYNMGRISFRSFCKTFTYTKLKSKFLCP